MSTRRSRMKGVRVVASWGLMRERFLYMNSARRDRLISILSPILLLFAWELAARAALVNTRFFLLSPLLHTPLVIWWNQAFYWRILSLVCNGCSGAFCWEVFQRCSWVSPWDFFGHCAQQLSH